MALPFLFDQAEWLSLLSPIPWLVALERSPVGAFRRGYAGGWLWLFLGLSWLNRVGMPATILVATYFAIYPALFAWATARIRHRAGVPLWVVAPLTWVTAELLAEHVTIFNVTWLFLGHAAWRATAFAQIAELGGISLVSALMVLTAAVIVHVARAMSASGASAIRQRSTLVPVTAWAIAVTLAAVYGMVRLRDVEYPEGPRVALVQGNVALTERLDPARADIVLVKHAMLSKRVANSGVALVAWPESTSGHFLEEDEQARNYLGKTARELGSHLLVGAIGSNPAPHPPSNSAFLFGLDGKIEARSDKRVLVPGAETLLFLDGIPSVRQPISDWLSRTMHFRPFLEAGHEAVVMNAGGLRFGTLICYDDLVPTPAADLHEAGADALIVLSDETWFGEREIDQHVAMASVRCIETRLPMARATNDGSSCVIDPAGRVTHELERHADDVLVAPLRVGETWIVPPWVRLAVRLAFGAAALGLLVLSFVRPVAGVLSDRQGMRAA